ncbi:MAG: phosphomannomutase/phosphoglucomutase [Clostridium sp.]|nr:phosphomannomutase/phosphoglucomutase [Clostridium sp.]MCM1444000.1 phosphomannomutase/phosphoglucomutase [Candidatus Amulumruptor caecigallinarius]
MEKIKDNIFREYDIRGIYNEDLTDETAYLIGRGFGTHIKSIGQTNTVIGHDNRLSSPNLTENLIKGILESGIDVIDLGLVTTPMYYYSKIFYNINSGIMVTASHNPAIYNGFKVSFEKEKNAYGDSIIMLRDLIKSENYSNGIGNLIKKDITNDYIELLVNNIKLDKKLKVVVDCGNGTGSIIIKKILDRLNIEYKLIYCESDGSFPNHDPDPSLDKNMIELSEMVKNLNYDLGVGIDGDADRVGLVDNLGNTIKTDYYLIVMYKYLYNKLKNKKALFDVKCSRSLIDELNNIGITPVMYRTGNSYINAKMIDGDFDFGGEYSGHIYFRDKFLGFDDGIYAGLRMIELLSNKNTSLNDELKNIKRYYSTEEIKINTDDIKKFELVDKVKLYCKKNQYEIREIDGVRVEFSDSWALIRVSNTTPCLTLRFEAETKERLEEIKNEFIDYINSLL